jgi:hypothetical protein
VPLGHAVNANLAMVSNFSVHPDRAEAIRRGQEGFEFFSYAVNALVAHDAVPGRSRLFEDFQRSRARSDEEIIAATKAAARNANGIGTPADIRDHIRAFSDAGVDQVIFLQQAGRNRHEHICASLELFAQEVMASSRPRWPSERPGRPPSLRPTSKPPWPASAGWRLWRMRIFRSCRPHGPGRRSARRRSDPARR